MNAALAQARGFPHPVVTGSARVAGRDTAVIDLGVTTCPSNAAGAYNGDTTVWIDKETFFVLKGMVRQTDSERVALTQEVTSIRSNLPQPASLFTYTAPPGVPVIGSGAAASGCHRQAQVSVFPSDGRAQCTITQIAVTNRGE